MLSCRYLSRLDLMRWKTFLEYSFTPGMDEKVLMYLNNNCSNLLFFFPPVFGTMLLGFLLLQKSDLITVQILREEVGILDLSACSDVPTQLLVDFMGGERSILRRVFGMTYKLSSVSFLVRCLFGQLLANSCSRGCAAAGS